MCSCMDETLAFISDRLVDIVEDAEPNEATAAALEAAGRVVDCMADSTSAVGSEKNAILAETLADGGVVLFAPEIGLSFYSSFIGSVVLCIAVGKCDDILTIIENLFVDMMENIGDDLVSTLRAYYLDSIITPFRDLFASAISAKDTSIGAVVSLLNQAEDCVEGLVDEARTDFQNLQIAFNKAVDVVERKVALFQSIGEDVLNIASSIEGEIDAIEEAVDSFKASFLEQISNLILTGEMPGIVSAVQFLAENENIEMILTSTSNILGFLTSLDDHVDDLLVSVETLEAASMELLEFENCEFSSTVDGVLVPISDLDAALRLFMTDIRNVLQSPTGTWVACPRLFREFVLLTNICFLDLCRN